MLSNLHIVFHFLIYDLHLLPIPIIAQRRLIQENNKHHILIMSLGSPGNVQFDQDGPPPYSRHGVGHEQSRLLDGNEVLFPRNFIISQ